MIHSLQSAKRKPYMLIRRAALICASAAVRVPRFYQLPILRAMSDAPVEPVPAADAGGAEVLSKNEIKRRAKLAEKEAEKACVITSFLRGVAAECAGLHPRTPAAQT